jgi:hypothetical protein
MVNIWVIIRRNVVNVQFFVTDVNLAQNNLKDQTELKKGIKNLSYTYTCYCTLKI